MIIVITGWYAVVDIHGIPTGEKEQLVSHGVDTETDEIVVLPQVSPSECGCVYDIDIGEYVLH
jgi:hypothetical protein